MVPIANLSNKRALVRIHDQGNGRKKDLNFLVRFYTPIWFSEIKPTNGQKKQQKGVMWFRSVRNTIWVTIEQVNGMSLPSIIHLIHHRGESGADGRPRFHSNCNIERALDDANCRDDEILKYTSATGRQRVPFRCAIISCEWWREEKKHQNRPQFSSSNLRHLKQGQFGASGELDR